MLAFQYNFYFGIVLSDPGAVSHQKYVLCGHTCPGGYIMKNQGYSVLTIYTGKLEIQVGKSNGPHHFSQEASENMGCDLRRCDAINLFFYPFKSVQLILDLLCSGSFTHHFKFNRFIFLHKISTQVVCVMVHLKSPTVQSKINQSNDFISNFILLHEKFLQFEEHSA